jgi:hypothetical protein
MYIEIHEDSEHRATRPFIRAVDLCRYVYMEVLFGFVLESRYDVTGFRRFVHKLLTGMSVQLTAAAFQPYHIQYRQQE